MNFIGCQQFRNINSDWNTEAGNTCREEFQGNAMKQLMNLRVYIEKVAMVINGACMESQYFRIRRVYIKRFPTFLGSARMNG